MLNIAMNLITFFIILAILFYATFKVGILFINFILIKYFKDNKHIK